MNFGYVIGPDKSGEAVPAELYNNKVTWGCNYNYTRVASSHVIIDDRRCLVHAMSNAAFMRSKVWSTARALAGLDMPKVSEIPKVGFPEESIWDIHENWKAPQLATLLAAGSEAEILILVGFDLVAEVDRQVHQFKRIFSRYPDKQFVFLNYPTWDGFPAAWKEHDNCTQDDIKIMLKL